MTRERLSQAAQTEVPRIEYDITRRLFLCGMAGAAAAFLARPLQAQVEEPKKTIVTPEGIIRTTLQNYQSGTGDEFKLVLTTYPPGVGLPLHHHPTVAHNYVLEGVAESQYEDEPLLRFMAGESYQDKAFTKHLIFRNADQHTSLKYLIAYTVKKDEPFLIIP
jgi:quercetin dioxygenase-like cupin family protein